MGKKQRKQLYYKNKSFFNVKQYRNTEKMSMIGMKIQRTFEWYGNTEKTPKIW